MDRRTLDSLYLASRGCPARVFRRAAAAGLLGADAYGFLLDHVDELDVETLIALFNAQLHPEVDLNEKPFLHRLAAVTPSVDASTLLHVLRLSTKITAHAWIDDLVLPLRGRLPTYQWYRFVDAARGGALFNELNVGLAEHRATAAGWDPDQTFVTSIEEAREEPPVVAVLERAHDDGDVARYVLTTEPIPVLLRLHRKFPTHITADAIKSALPKRITSAVPWVRSEDESLPNWMAPFVCERLLHCEDDEARFLYAWLFALPKGTHDADPYAIAVERFRHAPFASFWHSEIGRFLTTGTAWKSRGKAFIDLCIDIGKGFPPEVVHVALSTASDKDGATVEAHRTAILKRVHEETAKLLVERTEGAVRAGDEQMAARFLSALLSLDPGSFVGGPLSRLGKLPNISAEIGERIHACKALAKAGGRAPTEEGFFEAFLVLTGQSQ